jgi:hypothetical protein
MDRRSDAVQRDFRTLLDAIVIAGLDVATLAANGIQRF